MQRRFQQEGGTHLVRMQAAMDRGQYAAQRMAGEHGLAAAAVGIHGLAAGAEQAVGVVGEAECLPAPASGKGSHSAR